MGRAVQEAAQRSPPADGQEGKGVTTGTLGEGPGRGGAAGLGLRRPPGNRGISAEWFV